MAKLPIIALLPPEEAEPKARDEAGTFEINNDDRRAVIQRQIRERRGQRSFRDALRKRFGNRCVVTGCKLLDVLEAAHIKPYRGESDNHVENGLLLRSDIHTLFDLNLLGIEPEQLVVTLHPSLRSDSHYAELNERSLDCLSDCRPSVEALRIRYMEFTQRLK